MRWWRGRYRRLGINEGFGKGVVGLLLFLGYGGTVAVPERRAAMVEMVFGGDGDDF
jgi:hypothetical protein